MWKRIGRLSGLVWLAIACVAAGCHSQPAPAPLPNDQDLSPDPRVNAPTVPTRLAVPGPRDQDEADVREMLFRKEFAGHIPDETVFLSYGMVEGQWIVPPDAFIHRFDDLKLQTEPITSAVFPRPGEIEPGGQRLAPIRDSRGRRGAVYWVSIGKWRSDDAVEVEVGRLGGPLDGGGYQAVVKRARGKWMLELTGEQLHWRS
jgi:hypothetical protein